MCGIVGFVAARGSEPLPSHGLDDAIAALHHRGPDEHGAFRAEGVALGNTRLSIIDLPGGSQPMTNEDGTVVVVYNGEIWNHTSVRLELERLGHRFRTRSDTEVLAHGYEEWGRDLPTHLDGMFAFAVWDTRREQLFLARDRLGKKPLYVLETARGLAFGSDARSLFLITGLEPALDTAHVAEYLFRRYVVSPHTLFAGVERLPAAHRATYDRTQSMIDRYWQLDVPQTAEPFDPAALREALGRAVERRLMSDVPIGVLLSGGVDSSGSLRSPIEQAPRNWRPSRSVSTTPSSTNDLLPASPPRGSRPSTTRSSWEAETSSTRCLGSPGSETSPSQRRRRYRSSSCPNSPDST